MPFAADVCSVKAVVWKLRKYETSEREKQPMKEAWPRRTTRKQYKEAHSEKPEGALLFSCLGRGEHLYGSANHDSDCFKDYLGQVPLSGFFCNGEIGPVGGTTFLHGYTSSFGLFRSKAGSN